MKIYTKQGDAGQTALFGGARVSKASTRVTAYGEVDELNSWLGVVCSHGCDELVGPELRRIQSELFDLGAELARDPEYSKGTGAVPVDEGAIGRLEACIDRLEAGLSPLKQFVLPGGTGPASFLHLARTCCRRAERATVALAGEAEVPAALLRYLNRLSDLLFVMARHENTRAGVQDVPWMGRQGRSDP